MDIKTILTVLGTLFGAYLGASQAGKYTLKSVNEQINFQSKQYKIIEIENFMKINVEIRSRLESFLVMIDLIIYELKSAIKEEDKNSEIKMWIENVILPIIEEEYKIIKSINITDLTYENYLNYSLVKDLLDALIRFLNNYTKNKKDISYKLVLSYVVNIYDQIQELKRRIDENERNASIQLDNIKQ